MPIRTSSSGAPAGNNVLKGQVDASLAANLPTGPSIGDRYSISVAGTFENDASILPASYAFTVGDRIEWDGTNWLASDLGDDLVAHEASNTEHGISAFGSTLVDDADAATARATLSVPATDPTGVTGADQITNIMSLTQAEFDAIVTPDASTLYVITDATPSINQAQANSTAIKYAIALG